MDQTATALWERFLASLPASARPADQEPDVWAFGDSPEMADELGGLVARGIKTATAGLLAEYRADGTDPRAAPAYSVIRDGRGQPLCVIETTEIRVLPFNEVDAAFAADEGEGDRSLDYWRRAHWAFFSRRCAALGIEPHEDMPVVCERFRLRYPTSTSSPTTP